MATALIFLAAYAWQVIGRVDGPSAAPFEVILWITWGIFALDYFVNLWLAEDRMRWFVWNLHELLIVVLPFFRPLRLLRLVTLLSVLQRTVGETLRGRVATYVAGAAAMLILIGALAVLDVEQNAPDAKILTFGDAAWWAVTTITTVGYGDLYPVTPIGRVVAAALMMSGIAVLGIVTASIASWLVQRIEENAEGVAAAAGEKAAAAEEPVLAEMADLVKEIAALRLEIAELRKISESRGAAAAALSRRVRPRRYHPLWPLVPCDTPWSSACPPALRIKMGGGRTPLGPDGILKGTKKSPEPVVPGIFLGWQMRDSNPRRRCQLIYSQPPLAARVICRTSKEDHFRRPFLSIR